MAKMNYVPAPRKKNGCGTIVTIVLFAFMVYACLFLGPQIMQQDNSKAPGFLYSIQQFIQSHTSAPTTKQHSSIKLTTPSGSCFDLARQAAIQNGIDPTLYARQINQESGCQASICSSAGACGVAQLMPEMATSLGVNPFNVSQSLSAGAHLMAGYLKMYNGSWSLALACYNAGTGATKTALSYGASWYTHLPLETQNYITAIVGTGAQS